MKRVIKYVSICVLALLIFSAFKTPVGLITKGGPGPVKQDSADNKTKPISRDELVYMVDSILDLDTVSVAAIEMLNKYSAELEKSKTVVRVVSSNSKFSTLPAGDIYENFDVENLFTIATDACLPDLTDLVIASDSLGTY